MMAFLGEPETPRQLEERHARYLRLDESGEARMFTINIPGEKRRGIASRALVACLGDAAARNALERVLAFPRVDNRRSNSLCETIGFQLHGQEDFEYPKGTPIRVNAWSFELAELRNPGAE